MRLSLPAAGLIGVARRLWLPRICATSSVLRVAAALFAAALPTLALAQSGSYFDRNNAGGVLDRSRPDYQALGIDAGAFEIFPSLAITPEYDDNIYASTNNRQADEITNILPAIQVRSNWSRNEIDASADVSSNVYANHSTEDTTDYLLSTSGRLDILRQSNVTASVSFGHFTDPRTSEDTISTANALVQYLQTSAALSGSQTLNKLRFTESFNYQRTSYDNSDNFSGTALALNTLDSDNYVFTGRADYALTPEVALFVSAQVNDRPYDDKPPQAALDRNSSGYETTVGADFDITRLVRGQVQVGYLAQNYQSATFEPVSGPAVHARVAYYLSGLTTLTFTADRQVVDAVDPVAVSFLQTRGGFQVDQELLRNVILSGQLGYETDDFKGEQRNDSRASASASVTYLINRHLGLTGGYSFLNEDSTGAARIGKYYADVVSLALTFRF